jgi:hypothetical protein
MWNIDLIQMQQYYEILATLRRVTYRRSRETKNLNMVDTYFLYKNEYRNLILKVP